MRKKANTLAAQVRKFSMSKETSWFTLNHIYAFSIICEKQPILLRDLHDEMLAQRSTVNRIVWSLCQGISKVNKRSHKQAGLLNIRMVPEDMRQREITLTMKGSALRDKMFSE
jgi:DNA-binding MarR family transcriptional regulator